MTYHLVGDVWTCNGAVVKTFPIQQGDKSGIPYPVAEEAYKAYATQYGTSQSLERLEERGGFGWFELAILLYERIQTLKRDST